MGVVDQVRELVGPILAQDDLELYDVEYGGGRLVVLVDRPGGVDLIALTRATQSISALLDEADPVPGGHYVLEVSSPGLERTLRTPEHFERVIGSEIAVKTRAGTEGDRRIRGVLESADASSFVVGGRTLSYGDVERAHTVFEWGPAPRKTKASAR